MAGGAVFSFDLDCGLAKALVQVGYTQPARAQLRADVRIAQQLSFVEEVPEQMPSRRLGGLSRVGARHDAALSWRKMTTPRQSAAESRRRTPAVMRSWSKLFFIASFSAVAAGCSDSSAAPPNTALHFVAAPATAESGIYVSQFVSGVVYGFSNRKRSQQKKGPICSIPWQTTEPPNIAVDGTGNLMVVNTVTAGKTPINIGTGPDMCGSLAATIRDQYGYGDAVASLDALNGVVVVANQFDFSSSGLNPGSLSVCTVSAGCTANLTNAAMYRLAGVAVDTKGDCWASSETTSGAANLFYFAGCSGSGQEATGYENVGYGGLDFDRKGNLVAMSYDISSKVSTLYVYSGCNPACKLVGGPFSLLGTTIAGNLNAGSTKFAAADSEYGQVDVYSYAPTKVTYLYSFSKGLSKSDIVGGAAFNPASSR